MSISDFSVSSHIISERIRTRDTSLERLASGRRINSARDDAANLAISSNLSNQLRVRAQGSRNINDGISAANIADGALSSGVNIQQRLSELATQSANGTLSDSQRQILNQEYQALNEELGRIEQTTQFNGTKLFGGDSISLQGGNGESLNLATGNFSFSVGGDISTQAGAQAAIDLNKEKGLAFSNAQAALGANTSALASNLEALNNGTTVLSKAEGQINNVDVASEVAQLIASQIGLEGSTAVAAQNLNSQSALTLIS